MADNTNNYDLGYGKPPKQNQFPKGRSGNPNGRPKGSVDPATTFRRLFSEKVTVKEGNRIRTVSRAELIFLQMLNKAMAGDARARRDFAMFMQLYGNAETAIVDANARRQNERKLITQFAEMIQSMAPQPKTIYEEEAFLNVIP